jgi:hypothetical protein
MALPIPPTLPVASLVDDGDTGNARRPQFERLLAELERPGKERAIGVTDLTRLFRSSADRRRIDRLLTEGRTHVITDKEDIQTWTEEGRRRYDAMADLICLAYEGVGRPDLPDGRPAEARCALVDRYLDRVLTAWLDLRSVPREEYAPAVADVRTRLLALMARWGCPELGPLLGPYVEVADGNEPRDLPVRLRALVTVGVRNSALEDLHMADQIAQADWRVLTMAAAHFFAALTRDERPDEVSLREDPFAGLDAAYPCAHRAFAALYGLGRGQAATWEMPAVPPLALPEGEVATKRAKRGEDILHAMDERIPKALADVLRSACTDPRVVLVFPSLKHLSRNPRKLFRIVETALTNGVTIVTQNVLLKPGRVQRRANLEDYNCRQLEAWWEGAKGPVRMERGPQEGAKPGRNAPCTCGSGKKFKRCCGR